MPHRKSADRWRGVGSLGRGMATPTSAHGFGFPGRLIAASNGAHESGSARRVFAAWIGALCLGIVACSYDIALERPRESHEGGQAGSASAQSHAGSGGTPSYSGGGASASSSTTPRPLSPGLSWQWQLSGTLDAGAGVQLFVLDLFDATDVDLERVKASGALVVCQFSAGTSEPWRSDVSTLPDLVLGNATNAEPEETWLDVTAESVRQLMRARLDIAVTRGCDGVLPDSVDGYGANTGFAIGKDQSVDYLTFLANEAKARGLRIGLANCAELAATVEPMFDFSELSNCLTYHECASFSAFVTAAKPVLHAELVSDSTTGEQRLDAICADETRRGFSTIVKLASLNAWRLACSQ